MVRTLHLGCAKCALDLGDGSERGEYVGQEYILNVLGRPHRAVNIMYTYYPYDKQWPQRISEACADMDVKFAWDYPYDDYPTFCEDGSQFEQMRDIRRHGQEVMLTLTADCGIDDKKISDIASALRPFGRMMLRLNHECNGNWFTHSKRYTPEEIAKFFVRFADIFAKEAPNVRMVFCAGLAPEHISENGRRKHEGGMTDSGAGTEEKVELEDVFAPAYKAAHIWSADKYLALHYGWPYDTAEIGGDSHTCDDPQELFDRYERTYKRLSKLFGDKPFIQAELNADGDVTGPIHQGVPVRAYYDAVRDNKATWLTAISMYQFRDRGRLGLEIEDPNDPSVGIRQPLLDEYKKILADPYFMPDITAGEEAAFPARLRWGSSEDADGIEIPVSFDKTPVFCEVTMQRGLSLIMEFNGRWFYKADHVTTVDLMSAFFDKPLDGPTVIPLRIFATPPDGENHDNGLPDWDVNQYYVMENEPEFRIRYKAPIFEV